MKRIHPFLSALNSCKQTLLDFFFPLICFGCHREGALLCDACLAYIPLSLEQHCPFCWHHITPHGETCFSCSSKHALDGIFGSYDYTTTLMTTTIHAFKYRSIESLAKPLGTLLTQAARTTDIPLPDLIIPVPLHPWRLRYRGFNQSELLGKILAKTLLPNINIPLETDSLIRTRFTLPQQKMSNIKARKHNIENAFVVPKSFRRNIKNKQIWLIDDVATTGSTLEACAKALKKAGATKVFGIVLARNNLSGQKK